MNKFLLIILLYFFVIDLSNAQTDGTYALIIVNMNAKVYVDGVESGTISANQPLKIAVTSGEHYIQAKSSINETQEANQIVNFEVAKQKIVKLDIVTASQAISNANTTIEVANLNFNIRGSLTVATWVANNPDKAYPDYPNFYYAFEKGDEIVVDFSMSNTNGTNILIISSHPDDITKYSNQTLVSLSDHRIKVEERGIYRFSFATNHSFDRNCSLKIKRLPLDPAKMFNPTVSFKKIYTPVQVQQTQEYFVNSGSNATFKGGNSRVILPIKLPANTVQWYYTFSAARDLAEVKKTGEGFQLLGNLTKLIDETGALSFGINQLTQPSGADYCEIYLIDYTNITPFENKTEYKYFLSGSRKNLKSGVVKVEDTVHGNLYIGIINPDRYYGIHVSIEAVAIVESTGYVMTQQ